ncbi:MAG: redoxin domain-containing protein [Candidatus Rokubacteria bacterium]|nr:redoxin domain-containing protein [Candidatus Rokubacteria bacterium]
MAQVRLGYPEIQQRGAEVLQITLSTPDEARLYFRRYQLSFPYLCDPELAVHRLYGLSIVHRPLVEELGAAVLSTAAVAGDFLLRGERTPSPLPHVKRYGSSAPDQAVIIVDRGGIVRYVYTVGPIGAIPSNAELLSQLARVQ